MEKAEQHSSSKEIKNWSEVVEDLVTSGDTDAAISFLESLVLELQTCHPNEPDSQLVSTLTDLAKLYSSKGLSLKADDLYSRASFIQQQFVQCSSSCAALSSSVATLASEDLKEEKQGVVFSSNHSLSCESLTNGPLQNLTNDTSPCRESTDDDWEAIADHTPDELLPSQCLPGVSKLSLEDSTTETPKRRGRGTFSYKKQEMYSDNLADLSVTHNIEDEEADSSAGNTEIINSLRGTRHVVVLTDFSPSTRTIELEKLFDDFRDCGFAIRWVNDTTALAVFGTPSMALEAKRQIKLPFTVRILDEDDSLLSLISPKDLEPPRLRPKTSAITAQRLIAHGMGLKLPSTSFGSKELRKQEDNRRSRIITRQKLKDDAWGSDDGS